MTPGTTALTLSFRRGISNKKRQGFYHDLGMLLSSSIDILTALEIMSEEEKAKEFKLAMHGIIQSLKNGSSFSEGISNALRLSKYESATIMSGESTGRLGTVLLELSNHFKQKNENRKQLISLLSYPAIVFTTSLGILYFMFAYMVPMFIDSFRRMNSDLPFITKFVIRMSELFKVIIPWIVLITMLIVITTIILTRDSRYRKILSDYIFSIPLLRKFILNIELNRFFILMSTLTSAKVQVTEAIHLSAEASIFPTFGLKLLEIEQQILNGVPLYKALKDSCLFPMKVVSLSRMAEETNSLDIMFNELRQQYHQEEKHRQELIKSIAEPVLILVMGLITGTIVISMYLPIFQMSMVK